MKGVLRAFEGRRLKHRVVYRAARNDLQLAMDPTNVDWDMLEARWNLDGQPRRLKPPLMVGGAGDFLLLDRETFVELRGFNEVYRLARLGIDHNFLVKAFSSGLEIADIGGPVYHVNHVGSYRLSRAAYEGREAEAPWGDGRWHSDGVIYENSATWGLSRAPVREVGVGRCVLDFSWDAVSPLVDLRGVVLPVDRPDRSRPHRRVTILGRASSK